MDFDTAKENIQPLACGRNAEQLEVALIAESDTEYHAKLLEQRKEFERAIEHYEGDDPIQPWYDYIVWVEQSYPKSGKESAWYELVAKCLAKFENDPTYFQDRRMLKLYIKYIDCEPNPPQFYEQLYNNGIGTMIADLYLCWAHYYDYCDNFEKAESIYRKGLDARAQPLDSLEQAHKQFGFSMSQRLLYKDDVKRQEFRSSMEEKRLALTSLRTHKHKHVGSIRTGSAVKSHNPGRVQQPGGSGLSENRQVKVFDDSRAEPVSPTSSGAAPTSVVQTILNSTKKQENLREPGPWSKAKIKSKPLFAGATSSSSAATKLAFSILEDYDLIPLADGVNDYVRGIQLPPGFARSNLPQKDDFDIPIHRDDEIHKSRLFKYDKFMVFPSEKKSFSLEELKAYKWFKKNNVENHFTRTQAKVWENGYGIPIRLPPDFKRKNRLQEDDIELSQFDPKAIAPGREFSFKIDLIYAPIEEYSPEEILQAKWINGELRSQMDTDMELTVAFERREDIYKEEIKRRSMALGGRKSILPRTESPRTSLAPRKSMVHRKSIATIMPTEQSKETVEQPSFAIIAEQTETEEPETGNNEPEASTSGATRKVSLSKRKSVYDPKVIGRLENIPESFSPPVLRRKIDDEVLVEKPKAFPFSIFQDDEENANNDKDIFKAPPPAPVKPQQASVFQEEDDCNTQMFNFFIKSQQKSTPKMSKSQSLLEKDNGELPARKELDYDDDKDSSMHEVNEESQWKLPFASRSSDMANQYTFNEPNEMYRQKLSAIMEMTEESPTISSSGATTSSKSSNEDSNNMSRVSNFSKMSRVSNLSKINEQLPATFGHTLPTAAQLVIYEDEKELTSDTKQSSNEKDVLTTVANDNNTSVVLDSANKSIFNYASDATLSTISRLATEKTVDILQLPVNQSKNRTLEPKSLQKNTSVLIEPDITVCDPSMFKLPPEITVTTNFVMNFAEEKTETVPEIFHTREISFKPPPMMEDMTLDIPPLNGSIFELPREPTVPIVPKSPTQGDPDEITTNFSIFQPFGLDKTATDLIAPKVDMPEKPVFEIFQDDTGLVLNKSKQINSDDISKKTLCENNSKFASDDAIGAQYEDLNDDKENMKMTKSFYACINQTRSHKDVDDELWDMIKSPDQSRNAIEPPACSIGNKSILRKSIKPSVDDELYAILNSPPVTLSKTQTFESESNKSKVQLQKSIIQVDESVTTEQVASTSAIIRKSELPSMRKSELPLNLSVKPVQEKPKSNIDDEFYAMISSPELRISSIQSQPNKMRESVVQQQAKFDFPSLLEPMKEMSIHECQNYATANMSNEHGFAMSEEIPNTALFSLNMASIKNSTIVSRSLNERRSSSINLRSEQSSLKDIIPANQLESATIPEEDESEDLEISGIELTEKEIILLGNKNRSKFNHITSASSSNVVPEASNTCPQFVLSAPVSIRPSQFQPNDTKLTESFNQTASQTHVNASKLSRSSLFNKNRRESRFDTSVFIVEDTEDLSVQIHNKGNGSRKHSIMNSPFKNHYEANPRLNGTLSSLKEQIDPFDNHLKNAFLDDIDFHDYISKNLQNVLITARLGAIEPDTDLVFEDKSFHILKQVGKGSFGFVYSGQCTTTGKLYAFKQERPPNYWELYISLEIAIRLVDPKMLSCFITIDYALIGTNSSIFISEYCQYGSLFDICNRHKVNTCRNLDEIIAMILSDQMLLILDHLHASNIIHGDIKPDNFLLVKKLSYGTSDLSIKLIDYGRAIDLNFLPPNQTFTTVLNTRNFICTEMMDGRPWKYQIDLFCMASTIYTLICGKYMNVKKQPESKLRPYVLTEGLPSYCEVQMWENILYPLINVQDCNATPDLQKLRLQIREVIASKERFVSDKINKFNAILDA